MLNILIGQEAAEVSNEHETLLNPPLLRLPLSLPLCTTFDINWKKVKELKCVCAFPVDFEGKTIKCLGSLYYLIPFNDLCCRHQQKLRRKGFDVIHFHDPHTRNSQLTIR